MKGRNRGRAFKDCKSLSKKEHKLLTDF